MGECVQVDFRDAPLAAACEEDTGGFGERGDFRGVVGFPDVVEMHCADPVLSQASAQFFNCSAVIVVSFAGSVGYNHYPCGRTACQVYESVPDIFCYGASANDDQRPFFRPVDGGVPSGRSGTLGLD